MGVVWYIILKPNEAMLYEHSTSAAIDVLIDPKNNMNWPKLAFFIVCLIAASYLIHKC